MRFGTDAGCEKPSTGAAGCRVLLGHSHPRLTESCGTPGAAGNDLWFLSRAGSRGRHSWEAGGDAHGRVPAIGLNPAAFRVIIGTGVNAPRVGYAEVCGRALTVDTPGLTRSSLDGFTYRRRRRPMYPFETDAVYRGWPQPARARHSGAREAISVHLVRSRHLKGSLCA